jgi:excisionase family DNA binding protein
MSLQDDVDAALSPFDLETTPQRFVSCSDLADYLACDRRTIVRMIEVGSLPATKVGRAYRIPADAAREVFRAQIKRAS